MALKQQKTAAQVLVTIKKICESGVLDHTTLILNAPGASAGTKLISFVQFIEGRRLCDLSVVTVVQDDIRSLNPINTFADAVDNMIARCRPHHSTLQQDAQLGEFQGTQDGIYRL
jgi:hypothetical protein